MGLKKAFRNTFGKKKKKTTGGDGPESQGLGGASNVKTSTLQAASDLTYNIDNPMMRTPETVTPHLDEATGLGLGGASNVQTSMLQAASDIAYNVDNPMGPSWASAEVTEEVDRGPGLGGATRGVGFGSRAKLTGNELRRGTAPVHVDSGKIALNEAESAHTTHMVSMDDEIGLSGSNRGVFKADPETEGAEAASLYNIGQEEGSSRMAARAVASSRLDRALGTNVLSEDTFAEREGQQGVISPLVDGQSLGYGSEGKILDVDQDGETFKRTLSDLQFLDYLTGQVDRHHANIFVGHDGAVTGIDNDMAFGTEDLFKEPGNQEKGHQIKSMPKHIDQGTAAKFQAMDEGQFIAAISGRDTDMQALTEQEIGAAVERFHKLKDHVAEQEATGGLVTNWSTVKGDDDAYNSASTHAGEGRGWGSYLDRAAGYDDQYKAEEKRVAHNTKAPKQKKTRKGLFS